MKRTVRGKKIKNPGKLESPFERVKIDGELKRDALEGPIKRAVPDLSRLKRIY